ncbi:MAG: hypothetical protein PHH61_06000 [Candidatus Nanoarchaeia archaeon]|nr:hypothetical protein [Candidatus Nanoarchaeia archaeon]
MTADEVKKARDIEIKLEYAKKNGFEKFYDRFGVAYRKGLGLTGDEESLAEMGMPATTGSKVADTLADLVGFAASFSRTGGTNVAKPARTIAEYIAQMPNKTPKKLLGTVGEKLTTGAIESVPYSAQQITTSPELQNPKSAVISTLENMSLGGGAELGLGALGSLVKKLTTKKPVVKTSKYKLGKTTGAYTKFKKPEVKQLPSAQRLLLPEKATASLEAPSVPLTQYEKKLLKTSVPTKKVEVPVETTSENARVFKPLEKPKKSVNPNTIILKKENIVGKDGQTYYRGTKKNQPMSDWGHAMFAEDKNQAYFNHGSDNYGWRVNSKDLVPIESLRKKIVKAWEHDRKHGFTGDFGNNPENNGYATLDGESVADSFNPANIVDSADAWDSDLNQWFWERIANPNNIKGVTTRDGAISYYPDIIKPVQQKLTLKPLTETKNVPNEKAMVKLKTLEEKKRQQVASMTGSTVLPEQPKKLQVPEQYKKEMPRRVTTGEIEQATKGTPQITKLRTPAKTVEAPKAVEGIKTTKTEAPVKLKTNENKLLSSVRESNQFPEEINPKLKGEHEVKPNTELERQASEYISKNHDEALRSVLETKEPNDVTVETALQLAQKAIKEDDINLASQIINKTAENGVTYGREVQAFAKWGSKPEGYLLEAHKIINSAVPKELKVAVKSEVGEAKPVLEAINKVNRENIDQVFKDLTGERPKASKAVREWLEKQETEAMTRVKEYFKPDKSGIIKMRAGLPGEVLTDLAKVGAAKLARKTMDFAEWSVEMIREFGEKVKPYLKQIFDDSNKLIKSKSLRTPEQKAVTTIDKAIRKTLSENGVRIQDIAKKHVSEIDATGKTLAQKFVEQANLSPEMAAKVEKMFTDRLKSLTAAKKQQILDQMFKPRKAYQKKSLGDRIIELSNMGAIGDEKYAKVLNEKYNIPMLDESTAKSIIAQSEKIQKIGNVVDRQIAINKMMNDIQKLVPAKISEKAKAFTYINMLTAPPTHIVNVTTNVLKMGADRMNKYLATAVDFALSKTTGKERTITFKTGRNFVDTYFKDMFKDTKVGAKAGWEGYQPYGEMSDFKMPTQVLKGKYNPLTYVQKLLGATLTGLEDFPFYMKAFRDSVGEEAYLRAINEGLKGDALKKQAAKYIDSVLSDVNKYQDFTKQVLDTAQKAGNKATFRDANIVNAVVQGIRDVGNLAGVGDTGRTLWGAKVKKVGIGDIFVAFAKTPGALVNAGLELSPLGFLKGLNQLRKFHGGRKEAIPLFTKAICGTLVFTGLGGYLAWKGAVNGKLPKDKEAREYLQEKGFIPYSVNVDATRRWIKSGFNDEELKVKDDDYWFNYDWIPPVAIPLGMTANTVQTLKNPKETALKTTGSVIGGIAETIPATFGAFAGTIAESDAFANILKPLRGYSSESIVKDTLASIGRRFVPFSSILGMIRRSTDNVQRNVKSDDSLTYVANVIKNTIPGISETLPAIKTTDGELKKLHDGGINNVLNLTLNANLIKRTNISKGTELLMQLYGTTGETKQFPKLQGTKIKVYDQDVTLTDAELTDLQKFIGLETANFLNAITPDTEFNIEVNGQIKGSVKFGDMTDEQKVDSIAKELNYINDDGLKYIAKKKGIKELSNSRKKEIAKQKAIPKLKTR